jgi:hypothetical protein
LLTSGKEAPLGAIERSQRFSALLTIADGLSLLPRNLGSYRQLTLCGGQSTIEAIAECSLRR